MSAENKEGTWTETDIIITAVDGNVRVQARCGDARRLDPKTAINVAVRLMQTAESILKNAARKEAAQESKPKGDLESRIRRIEMWMCMNGPGQESKP